MTAIRELKEEVGLGGKPENLRLVHIDHYFVEVNYFNFIFVLDSWTGIPKVCEPENCLAIGWFAEDELPAKCVNVVRAVANTPGGFDNVLTYSMTDKDIFYNQMKLPRQDI